MTALAVLIVPVLVMGSAVLKGTGTDYPPCPTCDSTESSTPPPTGPTLPATT
jgi:hypothetical protein